LRVFSSKLQYLSGLFRYNSKTLKEVVMKLFFASLMTLGLAFAAAAQPAPPAVPPAPAPVMDAKMGCPDKPGMDCPHQRFMANLPSERRFRAMGERHMGGRGFLPRMLPLFILAKMMAAAFLFCALLHILLTVLVFKDMRQAGDVNGLWIVVVLMGGLLATIAYALLKRRTQA
jgi:hypothetical protein